MGNESRIPPALKSRRRLLLFAVVGGLGFFVDQTVVISIVEFTDLQISFAGRDVTLEFAKVLAAESAIIVMFLVNDRWTFDSFGATDTRSKATRFVKSNFVRIGGIAVATIVLSVLVRQFDLALPLANAIGILCGFLVNYTFETLFTWRIGR